MTGILFKGLAAAVFAAFASAVAAKGLQVIDVAAGVEEIDLHSPKASGEYLRSIPADALSFPIPIVEDRDLGFVIRLEGKNYYVGASDVRTNKVYDVSAKCDNQLARASGASRGIAGKGCQ